jgi:hypothetical protein
VDQLLGVECIWVTPPGWPPAPPYFQPAGQWLPEPDWPEAPGHWEFWQVRGAPGAIAPYLLPVPDNPPHWEHYRPPDDEVRRWEVITPAGRLKQANTWEYVLRSAGRWRRDWTDPDPVAVGLGVTLPGDHPSLFYREQAWTELTEAVAACRDHLLYAIRNAIQVPEDYFTWAAQVFPRTDGYFAADSAVSDALSDRGERVLDRMSPEQRYRFWWGDSAAGSDAEWQQAERLAAQVLRQFGFDDAVTTAAGADAGVDVVGAAVASQVKYTMKPVGRPTLQQLIGAAHGRIAVCFARSGYSSEAISYADRAGIALFRIHLPISVTAVNQFAARMVDGG